MLKTFKGKLPKVSDKAYIADNVVLTGDIEIAEDANVWFGVVMRGDVNSIRIGKGTNVQDLTMVHADSNSPTRLGDHVTIGHCCIIHGCIIEDNVLVGMGSTVMNGAVVGKNSIIGAGSLVTEGKEIPSGVLAIGRPAKVIRELTEEEIASLQKAADGYVATSKVYLEEQKK
ncbi:MAG: gamma carbonic anhydrase family protein [Peptostreptococcaceae bacterium]|nr:gamma carbonic anhydrase family protein [Peptostreptococcaceae bacterium]